MARTQLHFKQLGEIPTGPQRDCFVYADAIEGVFQRGRTNLTLQVNGQWIEVLGDYDELRDTLKSLEGTSRVSVAATPTAIDFAGKVIP